MDDYRMIKRVERVSLNRKHVAVAVIAAMLMLLSIDCKESYAKESIGTSAPDSSGIEALSKEIKLSVKELEYSDGVADDLVNMVLGWKDEKRMPVLVVLKEELAGAKEDHSKGTISADELANAEEKIAKKLRGRIEKEFGADLTFFELPDVIKYKKFNCLGSSQVFYILGRSIGLSVKIINVVIRMSDIPPDEGHVASIVALSDAKTLMIDLSIPSIGGGKPFKLEEEFTKVGNYWGLKSKNNPLNFHRRFQILDENGVLAALYDNRGLTCNNLGQYDSAFPSYSKAINLYPELAETYYNRGRAYTKLGQYDKAIPDYDKALEINPKYAKAYCNRGVTYSEMGQYDKAISDLTRSIELNPDDAESYNNRGGTYGKSGQYDKALSECTKAIGLNPKYVSAYYNRGGVYGGLGQHNKAISDYSRAIELDPKQAKLYRNRGISYGSLSQYAKAISDYDKAIELDPKEPDAYFNRGNAYIGLGQRDKAISDYTTTIELNPKHAKAYYNRGFAYSNLGQDEKAFSDYNKAIELNPEDSDAYCNRGYSFLAFDQHEKAISDFSKALELNPNNAKACGNRAISYYFTKQYDKSWEDVHRTEALGGKVHPGFLNSLKNDSGRER